MLVQGMDGEPLIKYYFPTEEASEESQRERGTRIPSPLFYLHLWWARRPLAGCRATIATAITKVDGPPGKKFIEEFKRAIHLWPKPDRPAYNYSPSLEWIAKHSDIKNARLLDLFAGGGSIPFEALRLGFKEVVAVEYNPVAYIILKATLEYPLKYGEKLVKDVEKWGRWLLKEARKALAKYYPTHPKGKPTNYIWVRVYKCHCGKEVPAIVSPLLSKKSSKFLVIEYEKERPVIKIVKRRRQVSEQKKIRGITCPNGHVLSDKVMRQQYARAMKSWEESGKYGFHPAVLAAVKLENGDFVEPTNEMLKAIELADFDLRSKWNEFLMEDLLPLENAKKGDANRIFIRGIDKYIKMFNSRQILTHVTIIRLIRKAYEMLIAQGHDSEYAKAIVTYLALAHGRLLNYNSVLTTWNSNKGVVRNTFDKHSLSIGKDYAEGDILTDNTSLDWTLFGNVGTIEALDRIVKLLKDIKGEIKVVLGNALDPSLYIELGEFDYVITDPPYYDNVQYNELSDFFYVWLKRSIGKLYPEAFKWELTPKDYELIVSKAYGKDQKWFESKMEEVLKMVKDILKPDGLAVFMYAHKSLKGLKAMLEAALKAGLIPLSVWGFASEQPRSLHIVGKAAVKSLLVLPLKPRQNDKPTRWDARIRAIMRKEIEKSINEVLDYGLSYSDALLMGMGTAFKIAGENWPLITMEEGKLVSIDEILNFASDVVSKTILEHMTKTELDPWSGMYIFIRAVYGKCDYNTIRMHGYGFAIDPEKFIKKYCHPPKKRDREKIYEIKPLTEITIEEITEANIPLVDALASAFKAYKQVGLSGALKALENFGYRYDNNIKRVLEVLLNECATEKEEKRIIQEMLALGGSKITHGNLNSNAFRGQKTLDDLLDAK